jgi:hypothetical protein
MRGYELLVPFMTADRERQAKEARLAHLVARHVPFDHEANEVETKEAGHPEAFVDDSWMPRLSGWPYASSNVRQADAHPSRRSSDNSQPVLGRLISRFSGRPKTA